MEVKFIQKKIFRYIRKKSQTIFSKRAEKKEIERGLLQKEYYPKIHSLDKYKFVVFVLYLILISSSNIFAQTNIAYYNFASSTGNTYSAITGGTILTSGSYDNSVSAAITMGGTFNYGGANFTTCFISSNGYVTFGAAPSGTNYTPMSTLGSTTGAISAFGQDGAGSNAAGASPEIRYQNTGAEFVVQFKDHANYYNRSTERLNFQIRLTYATGKIDIVYGSCTIPGTTSTSGTTVQVGIRGNSVTYSSNVNNLALKNVPVGTSCNWSEVVIGFSNTSNMLFSGSTNVNVAIPSGLKYTWTRQTTVAPVRTIAAPTAITSSGATISWTAPAGATNYDIQYRTIGTCSWTNWSGNPVTGTSVVLTGLASGTTYQVRIKSSNATLETYYSHIPGTTANSDGYNTAGTFTTTTPPVTNDLVCNAVAISCGSTLSGTTIGTTNTGTGENQTCGTAQTMPGVWYVVVGNGQQMTASLCATSWDSKISVFSGSSCSSLTCVGGNDDNGPACTSSTSSSYSWTSVLGTNYYILVHGYSTNSTFSLSLSCSVPPATYISQWIGMNTGTSSWCAGETRNVSVTLKNNGTATWTDASPDINIGVKWNADSDYNVRVNAGNLAPGATQTYTFSVSAPTTLGSNNLSFDIVYEGCFWFASNSLVSGSCPAAGPGNTVYTSSPITINATPSLTVIPNLSTICAGQSTTLTANASFNLGYCMADATSTSFEKISNVTIGTINNNSSATSGYEDFTSQSTNILAGVNIPITIAVSGAYANDDRVHIWADINQNGVFDESSERLSDLAVSTFCSSCSGTAATLAGSIIIPTSAFNGNTRLRIRLQDQSIGANATSCGSSSYGQVEDYTINISGGTINNSISYVWTPSGSLSSSTISNPTASPVSTTTYSVTATSVAGCTSSSTTVIGVNSQPVINVSQSNLLLCPGNTTNVTVVASGGLSPYTGIGTFTVSEGNQSFTVTDANGCQATSSFNVQSNDNLPPSISAPASITVSANPGSCNATSVALGSPSVNDNCTVVSVTNNAPSVFPVGTTTVIWTAQDNSGNISTATQIIIVTSGSTNYWTGNINSDWFNSANWCSGIPTISTDVQIPSSAPNMPIISAPGAVCRNIAINTSSMLTINSAGILTVSGDFTNNGFYISNSGKTIFQSSISQQLTGATTFWDFELINTSGLTMNSNVIVLNTANLSAGTITTGLNTFQINSGGYLLSGSGYVNGFLKKYIDAGTNVNTFFEIGSLNAYTPINIYFNNVFTGGYLTVNTVDYDHPMISSSGLDVAKTVNRYWNLIGDSGLSFDFYSIELNYVNADQDPGFVQTYSGAKINNSSIWISTIPIYSNGNSLTIDSVSVLGSLQIGTFNPNPYAYSLTPDYGYVGTTVSAVIKGNGFLSGVSFLNNVTGITINSMIVNNDTTITLSLAIDPNASVGAIKFAISNLSNAVGYGGTSDSLSFNVFAVPTANFYANKTSVKCIQDENVEFYNYSTTADTYFWDFGSGASPATATGFGPHAVTYSTTGLKTVSMIAFSPIGNDTLVRTNFISVNTIAPLPPNSITGASNICNYGTSNLTYSIPVTSGVSAYNWIVPAGMNVVSGLGTRSIVVNFSSTFISGVLSVTQSNSCGTSAPRTLTISRAPSVPGAISGAKMICGLTTSTYSITPVSGASTYIWTLPSGVTSNLGISPITTTSNSISVSFSTSYTSGSISVQASNSCGTSATRSLTVSRAPSIPGAISGATMICGLTSATYSITPISGANSYIWTLPSGVTSNIGASPITTTSTSITVFFASTFSSGSIGVQSSNSCSASAIRSLTVTRTPSIPGAITGPSLVCGITTATYSITPVSGATNYTWTLPPGVTSSSGASPITTTNSSITVSFATTFSSGIMSVKSNNQCTSSSARSLAISIAPLKPSVISGPATICNLTSATYSIASVNGANTYTWTLPVGVTTSSGANIISTTTPSINVLVAATFVSGIITVKANGSCASSGIRSLVLGSCSRIVEIQPNNDQDNVKPVFAIIYPNPANDHFNISYDSRIASQLFIEIYDLQGKNVFQKIEYVIEGANTFNYFVDLDKGAYLMRLSDNSNNYHETKKLIIQ